ncbi:hypothetical protein DNTS_024182 [Danionella cerebrum]|uniref:Glypican-3 n=1 Tax=Danionella cerebrum TaxID=2873325 RepID=A0A553RIL2_9TELE|nr:hypothetical protein DNTS_024182 [Danionella translucida]
MSRSAEPTPALFTARLRGPTCKRVSNLPNLNSTATRCNILRSPCERWMEHFTFLQEHPQNAFYTLVFFFPTAAKSPILWSEACGLGGCLRGFEAFDMVLRLGRNSTLTLLRDEFPGLGAGASGAVTQLFLDMSLYILGSDANVNDMVSTFLSRVFPLIYRRLNGNAAVAGISEECLRGAWQKSSAFGSFPKMLMTRLSRSLLATRVFLQALNLGIEVVNTTQHLRAGRECGRSLLKLWYCPHCQGLLEARPCRPLCVSTMGACLGGMAEVQPHWRAYVEELGSLAAAMTGEQDMEAVVSGMCAHTPPRVSRAVAMTAEHPASSLVPQSRPPVNFDPDETLFGRRREFISALRGFTNFYSVLGEALCNKESAPLNSSLCWNGQEMTDNGFSASLLLYCCPPGGLGAGACVISEGAQQLHESVYDEDVQELQTVHPQGVRSYPQGAVGLPLILLYNNASAAS